VRSCLLGVRESYGDVIFDPVLPPCLDGLIARMKICGRPVEARFRVRAGNFGPRVIRLNGDPLSPDAREENPYRAGGWRIRADALSRRLRTADNTIEIEL
jgi:CRISPR-associated protein Csx3